MSVEMRPMIYQGHRPGTLTLHAVLPDGARPHAFKREALCGAVVIRDEYEFEPRDEAACGVCKTMASAYTPAPFKVAFKVASTVRHAAPVEGWVPNRVVQTLCNVGANYGDGDFDDALDGACEVCAAEARLLVNHSDRPVGKVEKARRSQCARFGERAGLDPDALYRGAMAAWSNLNPQSVSFSQALSVAFVVLSAAKEDA